jgi:sec-independent protein translocase protein TatC
MEEEKSMSFLDHLEELRWRLVRCAIALVIVSVSLAFFLEWIMSTVFLSMTSPDFPTYKWLCSNFNIFCIDKIPMEVISTQMGAQFSYAIYMCFMGGIVITSPFIFYQLWSFVKPGLKKNEKKMARGMVFYVSILFLCGIAFGYFIVAPMSVQFFGTFQITKGIKNTFNLASFMSTIISSIFFTGLFFLLPLVSYLLTKIGLISSGFLKKFRKHAIVVVLILAAVITPPDILSQVIVSLPILLLYEIGIFVSKRVEKKRRAESIS